MPNNLQYIDSVKSIQLVSLSNKSLTLDYYLDLHFISHDIQPNEFHSWHH